MQDVVIIGGGYLGLLSGITLAKAGLRTVILERGCFSDMEVSSSPCRLFAISEGSRKIIHTYSGLDVSTLGQNINHIHVMEFGSNAYLDFNPSDLDLPSFGVMVEESILHRQLLSIARSTTNLELIEKSKVLDVVTDDEIVQVITDNNTYKANVALVCDGKNSKVRGLLGIETVSKNYNQLGIICDIEHEYNHKGVAIENFTPQGPFAILPKIGGYESSLVWTLHINLADTMLSLSTDEQLSLICERFGGYLGKLKLKCPLRGYPLELKYATTYHKGRFYLLGDALHSIHPLAGQGLNLSVRDFEYVTKQIIESINLGLDIGMNIKLSYYLKSRSLDNQVMIESTNLLNALFSNNAYILKQFRATGLNIVNQLPALKRLFMLYASGFLEI
jgi:2-octaprenyl-6-methoxyphenol hydroxylase